MRILALLLAALALAVPARADDWHRAESEHYVVHAKLDPEPLRETVLMMEDFRRLLETMLPTQTQRQRKAHIWLEEDARRISALVPLRVGGISGTTPEIAGGYLHHDRSRPPMVRYHPIFYSQAQLFIVDGYFRTHAPWVQSGVSSFFRTAYTDEEGAFLLGAPAFGRDFERASADELAELFSLTSWPDRQRAFETAHARAHTAATVLLTDPAFSGRLEAYLSAWTAGRSPQEAVAELGDLEALAEAIEARAKERRKPLRKVSLAPAAQVDIAIRPMSEDEIDLVTPRMERVNATDLERTARKLAKLTERHPECAETWYEYAATEFARVRESRDEKRVFRGFGFAQEITVIAAPHPDAEAWRAVNRALELDPAHPAARVLKAEILLGRLVRSAEEDESEGFDEVRAILLPLAEEAELHPLAAALHHQSFIEQGIAAPADAVELLGRAFVANPSVGELRYAYAVALSRAGQRDAARTLLASMLNSPTYREAAERALAAS